MKSLIALMIVFAFTSCRSVSNDSFSKAVTPEQGLKQSCFFGSTEFQLDILYMDSFLYVSLQPRNGVSRDMYLIKSDGKLIIPNKETPIRYYSLDYHNTELNRVRRQYYYWTNDKINNSSIAKWFKEKFRIKEGVDQENLISSFLNMQIDQYLNGKFSFSSALNYIDENFKGPVSLSQSENVIFASPIALNIQPYFVKNGQEIAVDHKSEWYGDNVFPKSISFELRDRTFSVECTTPEKADWNDAPKIDKSNLFEDSAISEGFAAKISDAHDFKLAQIYFKESSDDGITPVQRVENALRMYCVDFIQLTSTNMIAKENKLVEMLSGFLKNRRSVSFFPGLKTAGGKKIETIVGKSNFEKHLWNACISDNYPQYRK